MFLTFCIIFLQANLVVQIKQNSNYENIAVRKKNYLHIVATKYIKNCKFSCSNIWYVKNFSDVNAIMENEILRSLSDKFYVIDSNIILLEIEIYTKQKHSFHLFDV